MSNKTTPQIPPLPPASLTISLSLARHPAVGKNRLYAAIASGALLGIKVGRRLAIPVDELDEWVAAGAPLEPPGGQQEDSAPARRSPRQAQTGEWAS